MADSSIRDLVAAVLYEGYALYPYRPSAIKNRHRFNFGALFPPSWCERGEGDASSMRCEVLVLGEAPEVDVEVGFLQLGREDDGGWLGAVERSEHAGTAGTGDPSRTTARLSFDPLELDVEITSAMLRAGAWRFAVDVANVSPWRDAAADRDQALTRATVSTHLILRARSGDLVSLCDPPPELADDAAACENRGCFPVLVGPPGTANAALASPIILYDHPQIAPESSGDFCDATEIDEMLALRVRTMTEAEKREARSADPRIRELIDRAESMSDEALLGLHGAIRSAPRAPDGLAAGASVRLHPRRRADIFDLALAGRRATVLGLEHTVDGRLFVTVSIDDDPGRDLGAGGVPGHRFFFEADEVEVL